jgi:hypothetical protein
MFAGMTELPEILLPCLTLWRPWSAWIADGLKSIETRTHQRFKSLAGRRIGIIAGGRWDAHALRLARPYIGPTPTSILSAPQGWHRVGLLCTALVTEHRRLNEADSARALIDCKHTRRWGLVMTGVRRFDVPLLVPGSQGIKYVRLTDGTIPGLCATPQAATGGGGAESLEDPAVAAGGAVGAAGWHVPVPS